MLLEDASALGLDCVILAESAQDSAATTASNVIVGSPKDQMALDTLAAAVDVITFDHEIVDLELLAALEARGTSIAPSTSALLHAVDKAAMRLALADRQLPMPRFAVLAPGEALEDPGLGWPLVVKAARGGYDGRGVFVAADLAEATGIVQALHAEGVSALLEEQVAIRAELASLVCRSSSGEIRAWPVVETAQVDGVCREVLIPGSVSDRYRAEGEALARTIAEELDVVGVLAVELFITGEGLVINELAMRPHNSGHWTQDGSVTSQFENHLRAVAGLPLGSTKTTAPFVASVNVFGGAEQRSPHASLAEALSVEGAHVHLYGKAPRQGRKLGHVTVAGSDPEHVRRAAWHGALALGTPLPDALRMGAL
jgi:5-(carboxyamino)imidazole ribonucleotide synthase